MTKKLTTIILLVVVIFLLASTVYVSIILTSETNSPTTARPSRASEIDSTVTQADGTTPTALTADQTVPAVDPLTGQQPTDATAGTDPTLLAYMNPTPGTENPLSTPSGTLTPTSAPGVPSPVPTVLTGLQVGLPDTGLGGGQQQTATASPTMGKTSPTPQTTIVPTVPAQSMPVAGSMGAIIGVVVAGITIVSAFIL